jgi:hypothetical protein
MFGKADVGHVGRRYGEAQLKHKGKDGLALNAN